MKRLFLALFAGALSLGTLTSCGGGGESATTTTAEPERRVNTAKEIALKADDLMQFDKNSFTVKKGEPIQVKIENIGELPIEAMGHNVVILNLGVDLKEFGFEAANAKDTDYIPAGREADILAHTKLVGPGESDEITVTFPEAGEYTFLCSFPGHFGTMNGKIKVVD